MISETITRQSARGIYDNLGTDLDRAERFERAAKDRALELLALAPSQRVLHIGVGTGIEHAHIAAAVGSGGCAIGCDLSRGMLHLTRRRSDTPLCQGDALHLPIASQSVDRLFSAYMLDLIPLSELPAILSEFRRVMRPDGRMVLVSLTEGVDLGSRLFVAGWVLRYRMNREQLGGCRPVMLAPLLQRAGFAVERHIVVQRGFPSEILVASPIHVPE